MDYEKKYNEAMLRADEAVQKGCLDKDMFDIIFPPEESEDERIRKTIIKLMTDASEAYLVEATGFKKEQFLSYLEKQKEPEDKGEISDGYHTFNELYYYRMLYNAAFFNLLPKEWVHKSKKHHDGEECFGGGWFIVMANLPTGQISNHYELKDWNLFQVPEKEIADEWDGHTPQEAAERLYQYLQGKYGVEQKPTDYCSVRDEFDLDGNLKQKPAEWSEEDKNMWTHLNGYLNGFSCSEDAIKQMADWFYELPNRFNLQSKQEWSKEDETRLTNILIMLQEYVIHHYSKDDVSKSVDWLKSLPERFNLQIKQEWSEEDEKIVRFYADDYDNNLGNMPMREVIENRIKFKDWLVNRLKSLRPQPHWKPSEEQIDAVRYFVNKHQSEAWAATGQWKQFTALRGLLGDLLKLM